MHRTAVVITAATLIAGASAAQSSTGTARDCGNNKRCFTDRFAHCEPARFTSGRHFDSQVRYRIAGRSDGECTVQMRYLANPNPAWVNKPLNMVLDPGKPFAPQLKDAVGQCLSNAAPMDYQCSGPLRGARTWGAARAADGPVNEVAEVAGYKAGGTQSKAPAGPSCGKSVEASSEPLYPLPRNGRWGYVNRAGDWVIQPQWSQAESFSEGRAVVSKGYSHGTSWGVIDRSGDYVVELSIPSDYANGPRVPRAPIKPFSQGCAAVRPGISPSNNHPHPYFITRDGKAWLRDALPEALANRKVKEFGSFSQGLAWFRIIDMESDKEYGYIDTQGQVAIDVSYAHAGDFADGLAPVDSKNNHWGYIDPDGELAWPGKWSLNYAHVFSGGLAAITTRDDKKAYFDGDKVVIDTLHFDPPRTLTVRSGDKTYADTPIEAAGAFANGLAPVTLADWPHPLVYMDSHGKAVLVPGADLGMTVCNGRQRPPFHHSLARLRVANKNGKCDQPKKIAGGRFETHPQSHLIYINTHGQIVLEEPSGNGDKDAHPTSGDKQ